MRFPFQFWLWFIPLAKLAVSRGTEFQLALLFGPLTLPTLPNAIFYVVSLKSCRRDR